MILQNLSLSSVLFFLFYSFFPKTAFVLLPNYNFFHFHLTPPPHSRLSFTLSDPHPLALHQSCSSILPVLCPSPLLFFLLLLLPPVLTLLTSVPDIGTHRTPPQMVKKHIMQPHNKKTSASPPKLTHFPFLIQLGAAPQTRCVTYLHTSPLPWSWQLPPPCRLWSSLRRPPHHPWPWRTPSSVHPSWATRRLGSPAPNGPGWCLQWVCRRDDVRVCMSVWVSGVCVPVAPPPFGATTEGCEDCTAGLQHGDWEKEGGGNSRYAQDGEEE